MKIFRITELNAVLADWDEQFFPDGTEKFFSVGYIKKNGEFVYLKRCRRAGLRFSMKMHDMKAAEPVDIHGKAIGHVHPIWIHSIVFFRSNIEFSLLCT
jgi:hypothetical protein